MKTINLSSFNSQELSRTEAASINGGNLWGEFALTYILISALINPRAHIDSFVTGFNEGYGAVRGVTLK